VESSPKVNSAATAKDMEDLGILVLMPTYNNAKTLKRVISGILEIIDSGDGDPRLLIVNDGSTDDTPKILEEFNGRICLINFPQNKGKGAALKAGFEYAKSHNYRHIITIDSDGQHYPEELPHFIDKIKTYPDSLIMGSRGMKEAGAPGKSSFGNKFSNFWYYVETGIRLPDTQTGYRSYPIEGLKKVKLFTHKFELEIEVIVKLAWAGTEVHSLPIHVKYDPDERVSHFRPFKDFTRISILNTYLVILTLFWYLPKRLLKKNIFEIIKKEVTRSDEPALKKALALGFGVFFGIIPIWGFQLLIGIPFAIFTKLNKVLFIAAANVSIPPFIPFIILGSYGMGELVLGKSDVPLPPLSEITLTNIHNNFMIYVWGAIVLAVTAGLFTTLVAWGIIVWRRKSGLRR
jgi:glycosyltransferase involved in cell wall biosynthesis